jgi:hypothetical protein
MRARVRADFESISSERALGVARDFLGTIQLYGQGTAFCGIAAFSPSNVALTA